MTGGGIELLLIIALFSMDNYTLFEQGVVTLLRNGLNSLGNPWEFSRIENEQYKKLNYHSKMTYLIDTWKRYAVMSLLGCWKYVLLNVNDFRLIVSHLMSHLTHCCSSYNDDCKGPYVIFIGPMARCLLFAKFIHFILYIIYYLTVETAYGCQPKITFIPISGKKFNTGWVKYISDTLRIINLAFMFN